MTLYVCDICKKEFNRKSTYDTHLIRKNPCKLDNSIDNQCQYCEKSYTTKFNLNKHLKSCAKKLLEDDKQQQINELKKLLFEHQKKLEELSKEKDKETNQNITVNDNSNNTNTNNNIVNNTTNNINIYSVGKEDLSRLSQEEILKLCTSGTYYPLLAAEIIHCNEKYPEFQNILISNLRAANGLIKINDKWVSQPQDDILRTMLSIDKNNVSNLIKDIKVDEKLQIKLESTKDEIDTNESKEHMKTKIKNKLYSASKMIMKNKKNNEKN
jgi:hypothetical protein